MISIIIPAYNEEKNIAELHRRIKKAMKSVSSEYEIIIIDDGSTDNTQEEIRSIDDPHLISLNLPYNTGQSSALQKGLDFAKGDIIITMDADLQNDPKDIPLLIRNLKDCDAVIGYRKKRKDPFFTKKIPSKIYNLFIRMLFKANIHDCSCTLKAMEKKAAKSLRLEPGYHRLIPILLLNSGFRLKEVEVTHYKRHQGKPKHDSPKRFIEGIRNMVRLK